MYSNLDISSKQVDFIWSVRGFTEVNAFEAELQVHSVSPICPPGAFFCAKIDESVTNAQHVNLKIDPLMGV